jgi:hypothetical protein
MHFSSNLLRIKALYMFRALLAHPQEGQQTEFGIFFFRSATTCVRFWLAQLPSSIYLFICATCFTVDYIILLISPKMPSSQRVLGLQIGRLDMVFHIFIFCTTLSSVKRSTCPNQFSLCFLF